MTTTTNLDPTSTEFALKVLQQLERATVEHATDCDCKLCKRRALWAAEARRRAHRTWDR